IKFKKTNQSTCINHKPNVRKAEKVTKGQVLCERYATQAGEFAFGRKLKVAYMPWKGYNIEAASAISDHVVSQDIFTSVHSDYCELEVRDSKRGEEELTPDIPNVSEEATKDLDENGIIRVGAEVKDGDILIGKITPKGESDPSPEEKLLRAIFGDKAGDVKDASLKTPPSIHGVVIDTKLFSRSKKTSKAEEKAALEQLDSRFNKAVKNLKDRLVDKLFNIVNGKTSQGVYNVYKELLFAKGAKFTQKILAD